MDVDAVSPKSHPLPQTFQIPALWLPGPLIPTPAKSRESSISTACMEDSWPPKWAPPPDRATTPPFSYDDLSSPTSDMPEQTPPTGAQGHDYTDPPNKSWQPTKPPPSSIPDPLTTALTNARKTITTLDALSTLLATLLTAQTPSSRPTQLPHDPSARANTNTHPTLTDARILQILLSLHPTLDHSPASLHALHRLCMHGSHTAADDLAALQDCPSVSSKRIARFVAKWGAFPERASEGVEGFDDAGTPPSGEAGEISVAGCLDFVAGFASGWAGRSRVRVRGVRSGMGRIRRRLLVLDGGVQRDRDGARVRSSSSSSSSRVGSDGLGERCRGNIEHVLCLLGHVAAELDGEMWRRRSRRRALCARFLLDGCWGLGGDGEEEEVRAARGEVERVIVEVERDREALAGWEGSGVGAGIWGGRWDVDGNGRRWLCLSEREGGWGWALVMRADEIIRRICVGRWVDFDGGGIEKRWG